MFLIIFFLCNSEVIHITLENQVKRRKLRKDQNLANVLK